MGHLVKNDQAVCMLCPKVKIKTQSITNTLIEIYMKNLFFFNLFIYLLIYFYFFIFYLIFFFF